MFIYLIRHGESQANVAKRYAVDATPLTEKGRLSLSALGQHPPKGKLFVSPTVRTIETAQSIFGETGIIEARLHEISYGAIEGLSIQEALNRFPHEMNQWYDDPYGACPPEGETINQLFARVRSLLEDWKAENSDIIAVTHEGVIKGMLALILEKKSAYFKFSIENASMAKISYENGLYKILQINYK